MTKAALPPKSESPEPLATADWKKWRENGHAPMWIAALLSLNIRPTATIKVTLKRRHPDLHVVFLRRCNVLRKNYGHHDLLPDIDHDDAEEGLFGEVVDLVMFCGFAQEKQLDGIEPMLDALGKKPAPSQVETNPQPSQQQQVGMNPHGVDTPEQGLEGGTPEIVPKFEFDDLKKGTQYTLQTLGALLVFVEEILNARATIKITYLRDNRINASKVGARLEQILVEYAVVAPDANVHTKGTQAKRISAALNLVRPKPRRAIVESPNN